MDSGTALRSELRSDRESEATTLSRGLGWFSIALGMTGLTIPRKLVKAIDAVTASHRQRPHDHPRSASGSIVIDRPPKEVYAFYRDLSQLPRFVSYLALVRVADASYSHWVATLPDGDVLAWDTKITEDRPGELIAWRSVEGSLIKTRGQVTFERVPGRDATVVRIEVELDPLGNKPSRSAAALFTAEQLADDLVRLKRMIQSGVPRFVAPVISFPDIAGAP